MSKEESNSKNSTSVRFELTRVNPSKPHSNALTTRPRRLITKYVVFIKIYIKNIKTSSIYHYHTYTIFFFMTNGYLYLFNILLLNH